MRFTVTWLDPALTRLATIWNVASDQQAVADAADRIDRELRDDADRKVIVESGFCFYRVFPIVVAVEIVPDDCLVKVIMVFRAKSP